MLTHIIHLFANHSKQRCDIVPQNKLCYNCLGHHKVSVCNLRHRCCNYQRKHYTSLCTNSQHSGTSDSEQSIQLLNLQQNLCVQSHPPTSASTTSADFASLSVTVPPPQNTVCLLKIAVATINNGLNHTRANLLFDEGS